MPLSTLLGVVSSKAGFHRFPRDQNFEGKWLSASNLRTRLYKWGASHRVCSVHFRGRHIYGSTKIPAIFPRPDMKTYEIVWPVDISHLQAKKLSEEKEHQNNDNVNHDQYRQSHSPVCSSQLIWSKRTTRHKQHLNLGSYKDLLSQGKPKKRMWIHVIINLVKCNNFDTIIFVTLSLLFYCFRDRHATLLVENLTGEVMRRYANLIHSLSTRTASRPFRNCFKHPLLKLRFFCLPIIGF